MAMAKRSVLSRELDGRRAPKHRPRNTSAKPVASPPSVDSLIELFHEAPTASEDRPVLSLTSVRVQLESMVRDVLIIDRLTIHGAKPGVDLPAKELTNALNGLVKAGSLLRSAIPGLFFREAKTGLQSKQIAIARLAMARYLAALEGDGGIRGILRAFNQLDSLVTGNESLLLPPPPSPAQNVTPEEDLPRQILHIGEVPLLDVILPQWRKIGDPGWVSPLRRHRGNWVEQAFMPVFEFLSKHLLILFILRGWPVEAFAQGRSQARKRFFEAFGQALVLCGKPTVASRSLYPHLDQAREWIGSPGAAQEMALLLDMDRTRLRDAQRSTRGGKLSRL